MQVDAQLHNRYEVQAIPVAEHAAFCALPCALS